MSFYVARPAEPQKRLLANATPATRRRFAIIARTTHPVAGSTRGRARNAGRSSVFLTLPLWYTRRLGVLPPPLRRHPPLRSRRRRDGRATRHGHHADHGAAACSPDDERETRPRSDAFRDAIERRLPELFREAARARRMREVPNSPPIGVAATGCLRAALLLLLFFMLASLAMPLLLGAFIQLMSQ